MDKKKSLLIIVFVFIILFAGAFFLYDKFSGQVEREALSIEKTEDAEEIEDTDTVEESAEEDTEESKTAAPDFIVYDIDGNEFELSQFKGKPIIINFWASWCGPCKSEMPDFEEAYQAHKEEVSFLMINMTDGSSETLETASSYINEQQYQFPVYYDTEYNASLIYGITSLPTTFFIDEEGYIVAYAAGALDKETLQRGIDMLITK